ncbi:EAL domain-containing protein [uncultured Luteimonas sp.]|uniref:putative bifunctional diguanylate cyclase/phosphodiesterase n=1 Tax=uncultured Luteimonas sp. TaxID=453144 RepID=UPI0026053FC4|nr:EAL domain-containing protein [uncultured Luteimonas sp.]
MVDGFRLSTALLGSRFGRRLFIMFGLAALLPTAVVFWMTYRTATDDAEQARHAFLREGGKNYALGVYERLQLADRALALADPDALAAGSEAHLAVFFRNVSVAAWPPSPDDRGPAAAQFAAAADTLDRLHVAPGAGAMPTLLRVTGDRVLAGTLDPAFLWGDPSEMSHAMRICMYAGRTRLFCGGHPGTEAGERLVVAGWDLFLRPAFGADDWTAFAVSGPGHSLAHYRGVLVPAAIAVLLLVVLLSSVQIRRVLVPLSDLLRRIQRFEGGKTRLDRQAGEDEFGLLARSFGRMQQRIGRQMDTLRMLSDVDRLIVQGASLQALMDQVAGGMRALSGCRTVCVAVAGGSEAALFVLTHDADATQPMACIDGRVGVPASAEGRWHPVAGLAPGCVRDACQRDGVGVVFVLETAAHPGRVQVVLGFDRRPEEIDGPLLKATKLAEAIPVALAVDEGRRQLVFQARHDPLTLLPNRLATFEAVDAAIEKARRDGTGFAVAFLDLDRFKSINDGLGHASGDALLVAVGERIRDSLLPGDLVGRFGGDEFCVLLAGADTPEAAERAMQRIVDGLSLPVRAAGREFVQRFSAGIAFYPGHGADASTLIRNADVAMYHGKRAGGLALRVFAPEMNDAAQSRLQLEQDLRQAIAEGAIDVHYQPRVDSRDGRIVGAEALARWMHPRSGPVSPGVFIALAEETGLIDDLGELVLRKATGQLAQWTAAGLGLPVVAVNVSSHQLRSRRLADTLRAALDAAGIAPSQLEIEITESMLVRDREAGEHQLQRIRDLGVGIAIDDFGTGYSSLSYLVSLPFDTLKIDRSFVLDLGDGTTPAAAIVRAVVGLTRELGKDVIAEGVEAMAEVDLLAGMGCHTIQGYVYHRPMPADELTALLRARAQG